MHKLVRLGQASLLTICMLSACAAADPPASRPASAQARSAPSGVFGNFLSGRFAVSQAESNTATDEFLKALSARPGDHELQQQAFVAAVISGRAEALPLARQLPENQVAQLVMGDQAAREGNWAAAEQHFRDLPRQGATQLLQPLLIAWARQGGGDTDGALATLLPHVQGQKFQGIFALHAGMIADLAGRNAEAASFYATAQAAMPEMNLRLAQILASWQARSGHPEEALRTFARLVQTFPDSAIALPALNRAEMQRPVANATDGLAETYLAMAGALRAQDFGAFAMIMARLALDLRPDLTGARLVASEILAYQRHPTAALQMMAAVPASDPIAPLISLRRAALADRLGHTDEALQALDKLATEYPTSTAPLIQRGDILRGKQRFADAITAYSKAIALVRDPGTADWLVFYSRGVAYEQTHQWPQAEADLHRALQLAPDQPAILNYLGYSWADMGIHLDEARQMIQRAATSRPNDGAIVDSLGWVMLRQGDVTGAVTTLERAVELEPEDPTITGHLGDAYWAAGRSLEAQYQWRRALTLNPTADDVLKLEAKLQTGQKPSVVSGQ